jgi:hypothetical protein
MNPRDLLRPGPLVLGMLVVGAAGLAAGYLIARDPERLRRIGKRVAEGVDRASGAFAEVREELEDLWAAATDEARSRLGTVVEATAPAAAAATAQADQPDGAARSADS